MASLGSGEMSRVLELWHGTAQHGTAYAPTTVTSTHHSPTLCMGQPAGLQF